MKVNQEIIEKALKTGILIKDNNGYWKPLVGVIALIYYLQFQKFALVYTPANPQDAKVLFLDDFKKTWDVK